MNFLPGRKLLFDKVYSAFYFAFGLWTPCSAHFRGKSKGYSQVFKDGVPYGLSVFSGAKYYGLHSVGKDYVGYSAEVFKPVDQAADEGMYVAAVCEFYVYSSGVTQLP